MQVGSKEWIRETGTPPQEHVVLVDSEDRVLGEMEKMEAHRKGVLHRAFSVFVFNSSGDMLLQRRAHGKYHSSGLWTNTCCSHPRPGETLQQAAGRRLQEEMGMSCALESPFWFIYRSELDDGLIEHELDHVLLGWSDALPTPNPDEVCEWRYESPGAIRKELTMDADRFTAWFRICFERAAASAAARA